MTTKENIKEILICNFSGFKDEYIETATNRIMETIDNAQPVEPEITNDDLQAAMTESYHLGYELAETKFKRPHGKWLIEGGTTFHFCCSECGCAGDNWDKFCKHCGAKMDGGAK